MKILVVKRDKVGDLLLATPMLQALRAALPGARIDLLATDYNAWVVADCPSIDRIWTYRRARAGSRLFPGAALDQLILWARLRAVRYDVAIAANGEESPRATRRALLAAAKRTIAYSERSTRGLTDPLPPPLEGHERERLMRLLSPLGIELPRIAPEPAFTPSAAAMNEALRWLSGRELERRGYVVIGLGARRASKQPSAAQVLRWSGALHERHGLATVFIWTPGGSADAAYPGDDDAASRVLAARAPHIHAFRGPLQPAVGLVWHARTAVFPDSGLMHLAAASPGGVLGLFAEPRQSPPPQRWRPLGARAECLVAEQRVAELCDTQVLERIESLLSRVP